MSCIPTPPRHQSLTRKVLTLSRKAVNLLHPSRFLAIVTDRKGARFSLISCADYQATIASQRRSDSPVEISGFHVVCALCDGFAVKNGTVRSCGHQTDSSSSISGGSVRTKRESAGVCDEEQMDGGRNGIWLPMLEPIAELDTSGLFGEAAPLHTKDTVKDRGTRGVRHSREAVDTRGSITSTSPCQNTAANAGAAARDTRFRRKNENRTSLNVNRHTISEIENLAGSVRGEQPPCDPEILMQNWRAWSERWERLVKSR